MQQPEPDRPTWLGNRPRLYEYVCPYEDLAKWLDESQGLVEANLAAASRYLAAEIVSGLVKSTAASADCNFRSGSLD